MEELCIYCGKAPGSTRDHVPPQSLFPKPKPSDLVTVPCCEECRRTQSMDDEYFKRMILMRQDVAGHPAASQIVEDVHRSFTKPKKKYFTQALLNSIRYLDVQSRGGIYLGKAAAYDVDLDRLCRVIRRITLGLFYHELGIRLPHGYRCDVYAIDGFRQTDAESVANLKRLVDLALKPQPRIFGHKVFTYWFQSVDRVQLVTFWAFLVYSRVVFLAFTGPPDVPSSSS